MPFIAPLSTRPSRCLLNAHWLSSAHTRRALVVILQWDFLVKIIELPRQVATILVEKVGVYLRTPIRMRLLRRFPFMHLHVDCFFFLFFSFFSLLSMFSRAPTSPLPPPIRPSV
jgi:hypothetical protein